MGQDPFSAKRHRSKIRRAPCSRRLDHSRYYQTRRVDMFHTRNSGKPLDPTNLLVPSSYPSPLDPSFAESEQGREDSGSASEILNKFGFSYDDEAHLEQLSLLFRHSSHVERLGR